MSAEADNKSTSIYFEATPEQQAVLGLPEIPTAYHPRDFADLLGRAHMVKYIFDQSADTGPKEYRRQNKTHAGMAQGVATHILDKVVKLGVQYDAAVQEQPLQPQEETPDNTMLVPEVFTTNLLTHYTEAARRTIADVRSYQDQVDRQDQMIADAHANRQI